MVKQLKKLLFRCLFFLYLSSSYLSAIHFHNNILNTNSDCKVCIIVENLNSADIPSTKIEAVYIFSYEKISIKINAFQQNIFKGFNANAPPKFS